MSGHWTQRSDESRQRISRSYRRLRPRDGGAGPAFPLPLLQRLFTVEEANRALERVRPLMEEIVARRRRMGELMVEVGHLHQQARADRRARRDLERRIRSLEAMEADLGRLVGEVTRHGAVVKDLDLGLLDFPTVIDRTPAYLCWQVGEGDVTYWHPVDQGFAERRPLR